MRKWSFAKAILCTWETVFFKGLHSEKCGLVFVTTMSLPNPCSRLWCLLNKISRFFHVGKQISFSLPPSHSRKHLAWFFCWNVLKIVHHEVQLTRKIITLTPKGSGVIVYWKQNNLEKHKSHNEKRNMLLITEYYLHLNLLKKNSRVEYSSLRKFWCLEEKQEWYHEKFFYYMSWSLFQSI